MSRVSLVVNYKISSQDMMRLKFISRRTNTSWWVEQDNLKQWSLIMQRDALFNKEC